jgi:O-antigen ligase
MNSNRYIQRTRAIPTAPSMEEEFAAENKFLSTSANQRLRSWIIVGLSLGMPISLISPTGGKATNFAFGDIFMPVGIMLLVWYSMKGRLRLPRAGLFLLNFSCLFLSLISNSGIYAQGGGTPVMILEATKVLFLWVYFYMFVNLIQNEADFRLALQMWIVSSIGQAVLGIYGSLQFQRTGEFNMFANWFRAQGTLNDCNLYATFLTMSFFLTLLYRKLTRPAGRWTIVAMLLQVAGIFFSASRGGMLSLGVSLTLVAMITTSLKQKIIGGAVAAGALIILLSLPNLDTILGSNPVTERLTTTTVNLDDPEAVQRANMWNVAFQGFLTSPVLGLGPGNFGVVGAGLGEENRAYVHNTLLEILCGTGILGFLSYVAFISTSLFGTIRAAVFGHERELRVAGGLVLGSFVALLLNGLTISVENFRGLWMIMAIIVAHQSLYLTQPTSRKVADLSLTAAARVNARTRGGLAAV